MGLNLVYRDVCGSLNHKYYKKFDNESILNWFRDLWQFYDKDWEVFYKKVSEYIGIEMLYFHIPLVITGREERIPYEFPPQDYSQLVSSIRYNRGIDLIDEIALQVYIDEGKVEACYYFLTDDFAQQYPNKCAYLIHPTWELPETFADSGNFQEDFEMANQIQEYPKGQGEGTTYICVFSTWTYLNLDTTYLKKQLIKVEGTRVEGLNNYLKTTQPSDDWNLDLRFIRTQIENDSFADTLVNYSNIPGFHLKAIESDFDFDFDKLTHQDTRVGKEYILDFYQKNKQTIEESYYEWGNDYVDGSLPNQSKFQSSPHLIQASIHAETWSWHPIRALRGEFPVFDHIIVFDDLWATTHPALANSILNFTTRWDVLK